MLNIVGKKKVLKILIFIQISSDCLNNILIEYANKPQLFLLFSASVFLCQCHEYNHKK